MSKCQHTNPLELLEGAAKWCPACGAMRLKGISDTGWIDPANATPAEQPATVTVGAVLQAMKDFDPLLAVCHWEDADDIAQAVKAALIDVATRAAEHATRPAGEKG